MHTYIYQGAKPCDKVNAPRPEKINAPRFERIKCSKNLKKKIIIILDAPTFFIFSVLHPDTYTYIHTYVQKNTININNKNRKKRNHRPSKAVTY